MPLPSVQTKNWQEHSKTNELQTNILEASQPTKQEPAEQSQEHHHHREAMPRTTIFVRQKEQPKPRTDSVASKPPNHENIAKEEEEPNPKVANVPASKGEMPEFEEEEFEEEMRKMQIDVEVKMKEERMIKVDMRRKEDEEKANQIFLNEVIIIEAREGRRLESAKKTEAARMKADIDAQEWLEEALRLEADPNPTPSPNQPAKMPTGEEPWWGKEEGRKKEDCSLEPATPDVGSAKSSPAGASHHSVPGTMTLTTNMQETESAHETGCQSTKQHEQPACKTINVHTGIGTIQEGAKEVPRKPGGRQHAQHAKPGARSLEKARKLKRSERMSSSRCLETSPTQEPDPIQRPGAISKLSKLISRFETSPSPLKMPRPPPASSSTSGAMPLLPIISRTYQPSEKAEPSTSHSQPRAAEPGNQLKKNNNKEN